ncbi:MAG: hypothetical protein RJA76_145 [Bacteroidota bacterium]|jgi:hypothetical protein
MEFSKKIKVSWLKIFILCLLNCIFSINSSAQCNISAPTKLVYISKDIFDKNAANLKDVILPITISQSSPTISWKVEDKWSSYFDFTFPQKPTILLSKLNNFEQGPSSFDLNFYCDAKEYAIKIHFLPAVHPRNAITVNGVNDGKNDFWNIMNIEKYDSPIIKVVNRWGNVVFESTQGYKVSNELNDPAPFKFLFMGRDALNNRLPTGAYFYSIVPHPDYPEIIGELTIIR